MSLRFNERLQRRLLSSLFFLVGLFLFLPFLSINYEMNGILEATGVEASQPFFNPHRLLNPNHLFYRPLGLLVYKVLQNYAQYEGASFFVLQVITAIFASFGLAFGFLAFLDISQSTKRAVLATVGMAVSWSYWRFSTEASYLPVAVPFVMIAIFGLMRARPGSERAGFYALISGVACAGAILIWQANIFLWLILGFGYLILYQSPKIVFNRQLVLMAFLTLGIAGLMVGLAYITVGFIFFEIRTSTDFLSWVLNHESGSGKIPLWGRWGIDRLQQLPITIIASLIPVWDGLGIRALLSGVINPAKLLAQISLLACLLLYFGSFIFAVRHVLSKQAKSRTLVWLVMSYTLYLPFILWWDPTEPLWFIILNIFFWGIVAVAWGFPAQDKMFYSLPLLILIISIIGIANFTQTIWPNHTKPNDMLQRATCVSSYMKPQDLLLASDWFWPGYVSYFYSRPVKSLVWYSENPDTMLEFIRENVAEVRQAGGEVIMMDMNNYPLDYLAWLQANTALDLEQFKQVQVVPRFTCNDVQFVSVESVQ